MAKLAFTQNCHCLVRIFNLTDLFFVQLDAECIVAVQ